MGVNSDGTLFTNHNVYIVGAGFSADRGLPVVRDFLDHMRDARESATTIEAKAIDHVLRFRGDAAAASDRLSFDTENIEDLFSLAAIGNDPSVARAIPLAIAATIHHSHSSSPPLQVELETPALFAHHPLWNDTAQLASSGDNNLYRVSPYEALLALLAGSLGHRQPFQRDTFISLNYDTVIEEAAGRMGLTIDYGFGMLPAMTTPNSPPIRLLKLHGSVNWHRPRPSARSCSVETDYSILRAQNLVPLIVPPTWRKSLPTPLDTVWRLAIEALSSATRVAIVGYSMPMTDSHFKYLLTAGFKKNISLRRIIFIDHDTAWPRFDQQSMPMSTVELRARALIRKEWWDRGRATFSLAGARKFFLSMLRTAEWNRPWIDNASCRSV